jgi:hypothetical protein
VVPVAHKFNLDESKVIEKKRVGISNLKQPKKKANKVEFGLYHPHTGIPVFYYGPDFVDPREEEFRIHPSKVFSRRSDQREMIESQQMSKANRQEYQTSGSANADVKVRERLGTRNENEELEAISRSFAVDASNPFKKMVIGARSKSIIEN